MEQPLTFGSFISRKRISSLRETAAQIGICPVYLCELEKGKKTNPSIEIITKLIYVLHLDEEETALLFDLHAKANGIVSQDLPQYIMNNDIVRTALRIARDKPVTEKDWQEFIDKQK